WRRLTLLDPFSARFATSYMETLASRGDRAGALAHGKSYVELVRKELEAEPDRDVQRLLSRLRIDAPAAISEPATRSAERFADEPATSVLVTTSVPRDELAPAAGAIVR